MPGEVKQLVKAATLRTFDGGEADLALKGFAVQVEQVLARYHEATLLLFGVFVEFVEAAGEEHGLAGEQELLD